MALTQEDLTAISGIIAEQLHPIKEDLRKMKDDLYILARLNQLDAIRQEPRLRKLYSDHEEQQEA